MPFATEAAVTARVSAALKVYPDPLQAYWTDVIIPDAVATAQTDFMGALGKRGFTGSQILAWADLSAWSVDQAVFWALVNGGALSAFDPKFMEKLDHREELKTVRLWDGTAFITPADLVGHGTFKTVEDEFHNEFGEWKKW